MWCYNYYIHEGAPSQLCSLKGRNVLLALQKDVALAIYQASAYSDDLILVEDIRIFRKSIQGHQSILHLLRVGVCSQLHDR